MHVKDLVSDQKRPLNGLIRQITLAGSLNAMLLVSQMWLVARCISAIAFDGKTMSLASNEIILIIAIIGVRFCLNTYTDKKALRLGHQVTENIQNEILDKLERLGPCAGATIKRGHLSMVMVEGAEKFGKYFSAYLPALSHVALIPICTLVLVLPTDLLSAGVFILTAPLIPLFMVLIGKGAQNTNQNHWRALSRLSARLQESLRGLKTLKLFGATGREADHIHTLSQDYKSKVMKVLRIAFLSAVTLEFFSTISIAIVAVFIGFRLLAGEMVFQDGFLILLLAPEFYQPLRNLGSNYHIKMEAMAAAEEVLGILNMDEPDFATEDKHLTTEAILHFSEVSFAYTDRPQVLSEINLEIAHGECVVIAGHSGVGKSTLLHLAMGFLTPEKGDIFLNGRSLTANTKEQWHKTIGWMSQHPHLFDTSLEQNIALDPALQDDNQIHTILKDVQLDAIADDISQRTHKQVGEQGRFMSGGEGRRLALARVLLKNAPLLIMDEPSANLDMATEHLVMETLRKLKAQNTTMLIAAHREQTLALADRILTLQNGKLIELPKKEFNA